MQIQLSNTFSKINHIAWQCWNFGYVEINRIRQYEKHKLFQKNKRKICQHNYIVKLYVLYFGLQHATFEIDEQAS